MPKSLQVQIVLVVIYYYFLCQLQTLQFNSAYSVPSSTSSTSTMYSTLRMSTEQTSATTTTTTTTTNLQQLPQQQKKHTLFDVPVSNNGARCRIVLYKKQIPVNEVCIVSPNDIGGLKSEPYLQINPQGKIPALTCTTTGLQLAESDTICRYLLSYYNTIGPTFQPDLPLSNYICRIHDIYMGPIQSCMYKSLPPFGPYGTRKDALKEYFKQINIIEKLLQPNTKYLCGDDISLADATLFPSMVFANHMLPKFDIIDEIVSSSSSPAAATVLPTKLNQWFHNLCTNDDVFQKVYTEIMDSLIQWDNRGRWDTILGAGVRDTDPSTIFDRIIAGEIPATIVKETDTVLAFKDISPVAPAHVLVIPKDRNGLTRFSKATVEHTELLGQLMVVAAEIARDTSLGFGDDGSRIVINDGPNGGQEVMHLHIHVLGGRTLSWPPG